MAQKIAKISKMKPICDEDPTSANASYQTRTRTAKTEIGREQQKSSKDEAKTPAE
jgi:hypothetical protein